MRRLLSLVIPLILLCSCQRATRTEAKTGGHRVMSITVTSSAFKDGQEIPVRYACQGENINPDLEWTDGPGKAETYAVIVDDPDAPRGTFTHWLIYNIPHDRHKLEENVPRRAQLDGGIEQGRNDVNKVGYYGPCPPSGTHHYRFKVLALDAKLPIQAEVTVKELNKSMEGHVIDEGVLTGLYSKD